MVSGEAEAFGAGCWWLKGEPKPATCFKQSGSLAPWDRLSMTLAFLLCDFLHLERSSWGSDLLLFWLGKKNAFISKAHLEASCSTVGPRIVVLIRLDHQDDELGF